MTGNRWNLSPSSLLSAWRLVALSLLVALWLQGRSGSEGLIFILVLSIFSIARWRFAPVPAWSTLADQILCAVALPLFPEACFGLCLPLLEASVAGLPWLAVPALLFLTAVDGWSTALLAAVACAILAGSMLRSWSRDLDQAREAADGDRRERYDLERLRSELLSDNLRSARMAELGARARIARDLHDHAGHELTAAHLALLAYVKLRDAGDPRSEEMLEQAQSRVTGGLELLRTTVQGLAPTENEGLGAFEEICRRFKLCQVSLDVHGDTGRIPSHLWGVLEPCLKEGLTNGARHVGAEKIDVSLAVGPSIVRLSITNGWARDRRAEIGRGYSIGGGQGLRNLHQRARAVGGSLSFDVDGGFRLVCVLPIDDFPSVDPPTAPERQAIPP